MLLTDVAAQSYTPGQGPNVVTWVIIGELSRLDYSLDSGVQRARSLFLNKIATEGREQTRVSGFSEERVKLLS